MSNAAKGLPLQEVLEPTRILFFEKPNKQDALKRLIDVLAASGKIPDKKNLSEGIFHREELMSTGIGLGVAVPHVRLEGVNTPVMALGICSEEATEYDSIDNLPVKLIFMIVAGKQQHEQHLKLLSRISSLCKNPALRQELETCTDAKKAYTFLNGWEG